MANLGIVLMIVGLVSLGCATFNFTPPRPWINFGRLGMFLWLAAVIFGTGFGMR